MILLLRPQAFSSYFFGTTRKVWGCLNKKPRLNKSKDRSQRTEHLRVKPLVYRLCSRKAVILDNTASLGHTCLRTAGFVARKELCWWSQDHRSLQTSAVSFLPCVKAETVGKKCPRQGGHQLETLSDRVLREILGHRTCKQVPSLCLRRPLVSKRRRGVSSSAEPQMQPVTEEVTCAARSHPTGRLGGVRQHSGTRPRRCSRGRFRPLSLPHLQLPGSPSPSFFLSNPPKAAS